MRVLLVHNHELVIDDKDLAEIAASVFGQLADKEAIEPGHFLDFKRVAYWDSFEALAPNCRVDLFYCAYMDTKQDDSMVVALHGSEWLDIANEFSVNKILKAADATLDMSYQSDGSVYDNAVGAVIYVKALYDVEYKLAYGSDSDCFRGVAIKFAADEHAMQAVDRSVLKSDYTPHFLKVVK